MAVQDANAFRKHMRDHIKNTGGSYADELDIALDCFMAGLNNQDFPVGTFQADFESLYSEPEYAEYVRLKEKFEKKKK